MSGVCRRRILAVGVVEFDIFDPSKVYAVSGEGASIATRMDAPTGTIAFEASQYNLESRIVTGRQDSFYTWQVTLLTGARAR